jgi:16S rRNA U516 pseudouridylate synthase RsuA-like enzyme
VKFGPVELGDLPVGKVRSLTKVEMKALEKL